MAKKGIDQLVPDLKNTLALASRNAAHKITLGVKEAGHTHTHTHTSVKLSCALDNLFNESLVIYKHTQTHVGTHIVMTHTLHNTGVISSTHFMHTYLAKFQLQGLSVLFAAFLDRSKLRSQVNHLLRQNISLLGLKNNTKLCKHVQYVGWLI